MKVIGELLMILGYITAILGGLGILIWSIYNLAVHGGQMSSLEIFWAILWILLRDIIAIGGGIILIVAGAGLVNDN